MVCPQGPSIRHTKTTKFGKITPQERGGFMKHWLVLLFVIFSTRLTAEPMQIALTFDDLPFVWDEPPTGYSNQKILQ